MIGEIVPFRYTTSDLKIEFKEVSKDHLHLNTMKIIYNAWGRAAKIDNFGRIWVKTSELNQILRTTKDNANYIALQINDKYKIEQEEEIYIQGSEIVRLLNDVIQNHHTTSKREYARFSEEIYRIIRDSAEPELLRCRYLETVNTVKKKLKRTRIKQLKIVNDELTNVPLDKNSEFSHIRIASIYLDLADKYWNGLIVHKNTHQIITKRGIKDEDQLLDLCKEYEWNTKWYSAFLESFNSL